MNTRSGVDPGPGLEVDPGTPAASGGLTVSRRAEPPRHGRRAMARTAARTAASLRRGGGPEAAGPVHALPASLVAIALTAVPLAGVTLVDHWRAPGWRPAPGVTAPRVLPGTRLPALLRVSRVLAVEAAARTASGAAAGAASGASAEAAAVRRAVTSGVWRFDTTGGFSYADRETHLPVTGRYQADAMGWLISGSSPGGPVPGPSRSLLGRVERTGSGYRITFTDVLTTRPEVPPGPGTTGLSRAYRVSVAVS